MPRSPSKAAVTPSPSEKRVTRGSVGIRCPSKSPAAKSQAETPAVRARSQSASAKKTATPSPAIKKTVSPSPKPSRPKKGSNTPKKSASRGRSTGRRSKQDEWDGDQEEQPKAQKKGSAKKAIKSPSKSTQRSKSTAKEETPKASQNKKGRTSKSPVKSTPHSAGRRTSAKKMVVNEEQEEIQTAVGEGSGGECANELKKTSDVDEAPSENVEIAEGAVETKLSPSRKRKREESEDRDSVTQNEPDAKVQKVLSEPSNEVKKIQEELQEDNAATEASSEKLLSEVSLDSGLNKLESEPMDTASGDIAVEAGTEVISSSDKVVNENDYEFISKDDVPPANSEEVLKAAEKMLPPPPQPVEAESAAADKGCTTNGNDVGNADVLFSREFVVSQATSTEQPSTRSFSIVSYNILADVHAQKDYTKDLAPWITGEQLAISSRHGQLMKELKFLDSDIICFQEVGGTYMAGLLTQDLENLGYKGVFIPRNTKDYCEGEATFYRSSRFNLVSSKSLVLQDITNEAIDAASLSADLKESVKKSVATHAVALLVRLKAADNEDEVTVANIHCAYDKLQRPDRRCIQLAQTIQKLVELADGANKPHIICGDFNSCPDTPPYQFIGSGHLNSDSIKELQTVAAVEQQDGQLAPVINVWPEGFQFPADGDLKSAYSVVLDHEPKTSRFAFDGVVRAVDYIWYSSVSLDALGVLKVVEPDLIAAGVPSSVFPSDHVSLKAQLAFK